MILDFTALSLNSLFQSLYFSYEILLLLFKLAHTSIEKTFFNVNYVTNNCSLE